RTSQPQDASRQFEGIVHASPPIHRCWASESPELGSAPGSIPTATANDQRPAIRGESLPVFPQALASAEPTLSNSYSRKAGRIAENGGTRKVDPVNQSSVPRSQPPTKSGPPPHSAPTDSELKLTIVIVNYRSWPDVSRLVAALAGTRELAGGLVEVVVV